MKPSKFEIAKFSAVMLVFLIGMVLMIIHKVQNTWVWIGYISIWWWTEVKTAKNLHVKLWVWVLILTLILAINALVVMYFVS